MLTENQLRAQISAIRHSSNNPQSIIGIAVPTRWTGRDRLQVDGTTYRLIPADTELDKVRHYLRLVHHWRWISADHPG